jgi:DNA-binding NarL/FixJ family response regulator
VRENKLIRVLLVVPSPALRAGLRSLLSFDGEIKVVDERSEWSDSLQEGQYEADVVITTSASYAVYPTVEEDEPSSSAILLLQDDATKVQSIKASPHVWGILSTDASAGELCVAVRALSQGLIVGERELLFPSMDNITRARGPLTDRETEVLAYLAKGLANKQIALALGISEHTVKFHISSIYLKLNAVNRTQAVREGLRNGWIVL